ncbi:hypothetical protein [Bacillus licheniformis]|uniref:hypothetical protein n=1 Tax=Bacillus licheniformis TaxID=1402 RepID=UPI001B1AFCA7|nr:hypothetical protein [Bacillus licheniformis]GIN25516.1 hypothetical protein J31TS2_20960 [Bacillus licheniformis]GIN29745.1 hypothetical protein J2TS5_17840 [Bacillus licheniformis]
MRLFKKIAIVALTIGIGIFIVAWVSGNAMKSNKEEVSTESKSNDTSVEKVSNETDEMEDEHYQMEFTPEEFQQHYNEEAVNLLGNDLLNIHPVLKEGEETNIFYHNFNNNFSLMGNFDEDSKEVSDLILIKRGDISEDLEDYYRVIGVLMNVFNPDMSKGDRGKLLFTDLDADNTIKNKTVKSKEYHGLKYTLDYSSEKLGLMFTIAKPEE